MGRVITNGMQLSVAREASLGVLPGSPVWFGLEPNSINQFGATIAKVTRNPISKLRARRKGSVSDLDAGIEIECDVTLTMLRIFTEGFLFARSVGGDSYIPSAATSGAYTVPAVSSAAAGRLLYGASAAKTLFYAIGWRNAANNGMKVLGAAVAPGATSITIAGAVAETPITGQMGELNVAGVRAAAGDLTMDSSGNLLSTALDFTTLGLAVGQMIWVGGINVANQFFNTANTGFARISIIAAHKLTLSKREGVYVTDDGTSTGSGGTPLSIDILFGGYVRNVAADSPDYLETSYQFELASPNIIAGGLTGFEYGTGNWLNTIIIAVPITSKITMTLAFVGINSTAKPTTTRATNAANALFGTQTAAFGTSTDLARLIVQDVDETGLTTDFKSTTTTINNNVTGEKVLGKLGPKYLSAGDIEADVEHQVLFTNPEIPARIRQNVTVGMSQILRNGDGGVAFDLPTGTLGGGKRNYPANQSVTLDETFAAHQEDTYGYTVGVSFFPLLPVAPSQ